MERPDPQYLETCILQYMLIDKHYAGICSNSFVPAYFDFPETRKSFEFISSYLKEYNKVPSPEIVMNSVEGSEDLIAEPNTELSKDYEWLLDQTDAYLKEKAMKAAILGAVDLLEAGKDTNEIRTLVEEALCKNLKMDLGINYWEDLGERLKYILTTNDDRIKTWFPTLDDLLAGGFPRRGILGCLVGGTFSGKCTQFNTIITVRKDKKDEKNIKIGDFFNIFSQKNLTKNINSSSKSASIEELFIKKYGEENGKQQFSKWSGE